MCERSGVRVAGSDPCFGLWLILHDRDYNQANRRRRVQASVLQPEEGAQRPLLLGRCSAVHPGRRVSLQPVRVRGQGVSQGAASTPKIANRRRTSGRERLLLPPTHTPSAALRMHGTATAPSEASSDRSASSPSACHSGRTSSMYWRRSGRSTRRPDPSARGSVAGRVCMAS